MACVTASALYRIKNVEKVLLKGNTDNLTPSALDAALQGSVPDPDEKFAEGNQRLLY